MQVSLNISSIFHICTPYMLQKIYNDCIKNQTPYLMTIPSYSLLIVCECILNVATMCLFNISASTSILSMILVLLAIVIGSILMFSSLMVTGVSCEIVNLECKDFTSKEVSKERFTHLIGRFRKLQELCKPYVFISYSSTVLLLIAYMYQISIFLGGCHTNHVVSNFYEKVQYFLTFKNIIVILIF